MGVLFKPYYIYELRLYNLPGILIFWENKNVKTYMLHWAVKTGASTNF